MYVGRDRLIVPLTGQLLNTAWPWIESQLARRPIAYTPDQLREMAEHSHLTVWAVVLDDKPVAVVMLAKMTDGSAQIVYGAGERMADCLGEVIQTAAEWCKWNDCHTLTVEGRKGWRRVLKKHGFDTEGDKWALRPSSRP